MRSLRMEIEYVKSAARLLDRVLVIKRGLDLREVFQVKGQHSYWLIKLDAKKKFCQSAWFKPASPALG